MLTCRVLLFARRQALCVQAYLKMDRADKAAQQVEVRRVQHVAAEVRKQERSVAVSQSPLSCTDLTGQQEREAAASCSGRWAVQTYSCCLSSPCAADYDQDR